MRWRYIQKAKRMAMERTAMGSSEYTRMLSREGVGGGGSYMTEKREGK